MTFRRFFIAILLIDLLAVTGWALYAEGIGGLFALVQNGSPWVYQVLLDLVVACVLVLDSAFKDAKREGTKAPFALAGFTVALGSIAPLVYLLTRRSNP